MSVESNSTPPGPNATAGAPRAADAATLSTQHAAAASTNEPSLFDSAVTFLSETGENALSYLTVLITVEAPNYVYGCVFSFYDSCVNLCLQIYNAVVGLGNLVTDVCKLLYHVAALAARLCLALSNLWLKHIGVLPIVVAVAVIAVALAILRWRASRQFAKFRSEVLDLVADAVGAGTEEGGAGVVKQSCEAKRQLDAADEGFAGALPLIENSYLPSTATSSSSSGGGQSSASQRNSTAPRAPPPLVLGEGAAGHRRKQRLAGVSPTKILATGKNVSVLGAPDDEDEDANDSSSTESSSTSGQLAKSKLFEAEGTATPEDHVNSNSTTRASTPAERVYPEGADSEAGGVASSSSSASPSSATRPSTNETAILYVHNFRGHPGDPGFRFCQHLAEKLKLSAPGAAGTSEAAATEAAAAAPTGTAASEVSISCVRFRYHGYHGSEAVLHLATALDYVADVTRALKQLLPGHKKVVLVGYGLGATVALIVKLAAEAAGAETAKSKSPSDPQKSQDLAKSLQVVLLSPMLDHRAPLADVWDDYIAALMRDSPLFASGLGSDRKIESDDLLCAKLAEHRQAVKKYHVRLWLRRTWLIGAGWHLKKALNGVLFGAKRGAGAEARHGKRKKGERTAEISTFMHEVMDFALRWLPVAGRVYRTSGGVVAAAGPAIAEKDSRKKPAVLYRPFVEQEVAERGALKNLLSTDFAAFPLSYAIFGVLLRSGSSGYVRHLSWSEAQTRETTSAHHSSAVLGPLLLIRFARELLGQAAARREADAADDETERKVAAFLSTSDADRLPNAPSARLLDSATANGLLTVTSCAEERLILDRGTESLVRDCVTFLLKP